MGVSASIEREDTKLSEISFSRTSGYQSYSGESDFPESLETTSSYTHKMAGHISKEKVLHHRNSSIMRSISKLEEEEEEVLEGKHPELKTVLKDFEECRAILTDKSKQDDRHFDSLNKMLEQRVVKLFNKYEQDEQRTVMGNKLARINFVEALVEYYNFVLEDLDIEGVTNAFVVEGHLQKDSGFLLILVIREILWNFSDSSLRFAAHISETGIFRKLVEDLNCIHEEGLDQLEIDEDVFAFSSAVGIIHNCARNPDIDREKFREVHTVETLQPFLKSRHIYVKMITLLALANLINEDEVSKLIADTDVLDFLLSAIGKAMKSSQRKEHGFHLDELIDGLASLAQSNQNKSLIMRKNPLPIVLQIIKANNVPEVIAALKLTWELAFLEENKQIILKDKKLVAALESLRKHSNSDVRLVANSAWFVIVDRDERIGQSLIVKTEPEKDGKPPPIGGVSPDTKPEGKHIMISYNWGDKETVLKIYKILLDRGYKIWIDVAEMSKYSNLLEGMARAVENAYVILICYSEKYKHSQNCRTEADYAFTLRKNIIPIKMQRGYNPDGWLGALIGARLFIEFSPKYDFDVKMQELIDTLPKNTSDQVEGKRVYPDTDVPGPPHVPVISRRQSTVNKRLLDWGKKEVELWTKENKMEGRAYNKVREMTGEQLRFMYKLMNKAPETFYRVIETKLQLKFFEEVMRFEEAIADIQMHM